MPSAARTSPALPREPRTGPRKTQRSAPPTSADFTREVRVSSRRRRWMAWSTESIRWGGSGGSGRRRRGGAELGGEGLDFGVTAVQFGRGRQEGGALVGGACFGLAAELVVGLGGQGVGVCDAVAELVAEGGQALLE